MKNRLPYIDDNGRLVVSNSEIRLPYIDDDGRLVVPNSENM